jgi:nucleotide-binding universal stress UspA family protein
MARCLNDVVVGVDGSSESVAALQWALAHVVPHGRVHAVHVVVPAEELALDAALGDSVAFQHHRERELRDVWIPQARSDDDPEIAVVVELTEGSVADRLLAVADAAGAEVVAVGHHPRARFGPRLVGHVTARLLRSADRPIAIVPLAWEQPDHDGRPVAVGVGVSQGTDAAIRWVLAHRDLAETGLLLVHALGPRSVFRPDGWLDVIAHYLDPTVVREWVERDLLDAAEVLRRQTGDEIDVNVAVESGRTGARLVEAGGAASCLVVGRGEPPFIRSHKIAPYLKHAITHAPCPVVVVPAAPL